ncbi:MAG: hypothetical protein M0C28_25260 [Candidatus Moduliflexus flocculans]|nr:hypothetical protein [Candidatus Moduliflexus flocculans]
MNLSRRSGAAPNAPTVVESGRQYVEAARIAVQLAAAIRQERIRPRSTSTEIIASSRRSSPATRGRRDPDDR